MTLSKESVILSGYIHDKSVEFFNANIRPAVLVFPGGGYYDCSNREGEPVALSYMAEGYNTFVLKYSVGTHASFADALADAEAALQTLHKNAEEWNIDKTKIAVIGFSAGGHLAAALGTMGTLKPAALLLGYPCILSSMGKVLNKDLPDLIEKVNADTPPSFIFTTRRDQLVPVENSLSFAAALDRAKVDFELHIFQNGAHGLSLSKPHTSSGSAGNVDDNFARWFALSVKWLKLHFDDFPLTPVPAIPPVGGTDSPLDHPLNELKKNKGCRDVLEQYIPGIGKQIEEIPTLGFMSLRRIIAYAQGTITAEQLAEMEKKLRAVLALE
jgi:acetyl esterase/lipase